MPSLETRKIPLPLRWTATVFPSGESSATKPLVRCWAFWPFGSAIITLAFFVESPAM